MAEKIELGKAYVQVIPSTDGLGKAIKKDLDKVAEDGSKSFGVKFSKALSGASKGFKSVGSKLTKCITKPAIAAGTALAGMTLAKGWSRMTQIDDARAKLIALGNSTKDVAAIQENALASVQNTAYNLDEAMTTAASAVAAGVAPGEKLTKYLTSVADAASIAGIGMGEMGTILNKATTQGKASNEILQQLSERGLPVYQWLGEACGKTAEEMFDMASSGEVSSEMLMNAIQKNIGGAAVTMGSSTISGAIENFGAAISRVGANFLGSSDDANSFAGQLKDIFNELTVKMGPVEEKAAALGRTVGGVFKGIYKYLKTGKIDNFGLNIDAQLIMEQITPILDTIKSLVKWFGALSPKAKATFIGMAVGAGPALTAIGNVLGAVPKIKSAFEGVKIVGKALSKGADLLNGKILKLIPMITSGFTKIAGFATKAGSWIIGLPAKIAAINPTILIVVGAIAALIAIGIAVYKNWDAIKAKAIEVWTAVKEWCINTWTSIKEGAIAIWEGIKGAVVGKIEAAKEAIKAKWLKVKLDTITAWTTLKQKASALWEGMKAAIVNKVTSIKTSVAAKFQQVKTAIITPIQTAVSSVASKIQALKDKFSNIFNTIKSIVQTAINKVKSIMNFHWSLPKLKLPHFSISGKFSLNPPSVPKLGISWYKKAMDSAMVLNGATIFGASGGNLLGGGEAGSEVITGESHLYDMIGRTVASQNDDVNARLDRLLYMLEIFFPQALDSMQRDLVLDTGTLVGQTAPLIDRKLGEIQRRKRNL